MNNPGQDKKTDFIEVPDVRTLSLFYTNDLKGEAEQMAYLSTVLKEQKEGRQYTILLDSGNWARGTMLSDSFKGLPMVEILSALDYDGVGIGEGEISFGVKNLHILEDQAKFPMVCCNLIEKDSGIAPYFLKRHIIIERGPFKIAVAGIASCEKTYAATGFQVLDPFMVLPDVLSEIKEDSADLLILLTGHGVEKDKAVARAFPDFNVIIGGGEGKNLEAPVMVGQTHICQAGEKGQFIGNLEIDMEATIRISSAE